MPGARGDAPHTQTCLESSGRRGLSGGLDPTSTTTAEEPQAGEQGCRVEGITPLHGSSPTSALGALPPSDSQSLRGPENLNFQQLPHAAGLPKRPH